MEFREVVRARRMTRDFSSAPIDPSVVERCVDLAGRSPSAGKTSGWHLVVLEGDEVSRYWNIALPAARRATFTFPGLLAAPFLALVLADPRDYLARYSEPDKSATGLGHDQGAWPAPYWTIDAAFATMTLLHALEDEGLGALFFAHVEESALRREFAVPDEVVFLGTLCAGHRAEGAGRPGRSAARPGRSVGEIIHRGRW
ncbi:MAG: nitroreductase family protein [Actinomycetota bacterium]